MKRFLITTLASSVLLAGAAGAVPALADRPPGDPGQPGVECNEDGLGGGPHGFGVDGFLHAETVYAGADDSGSLNADNDHAVSQYDVACFQLTQHPH